jgi:histidinol-phosphate/aromatic aminotransferase/cobyric acid decarboxylase-like protein
MNNRPDLEELPGLVERLKRAGPHISIAGGADKAAIISREDATEAADTLERLAAEVLRLTEDKRRLEARLCETQMLLVSCGNHDALAEKAKTWPEVKRAFADRCLECGGLHGPSSGCMGPPMPSVPHPHAGKMQG